LDLHGQPRPPRCQHIGAVLGGLVHNRRQLHTPGQSAHDRRHRSGQPWRFTAPAELGRVPFGLRLMREISTIQAARHKDGNSLWTSAAGLEAFRFRQRRESQTAKTPPEAAFYSTRLNPTTSIRSRSPGSSSASGCTWSLVTAATHAAGRPDILSGGSLTPLQL